MNPFAPGKILYVSALADGYESYLNEDWWLLGLPRGLADLAAGYLPRIEMEFLHRVTLGADMPPRETEEGYFEADVRLLGRAILLALLPIVRRQTEVVDVKLALQPPLASPKLHWIDPCRAPVVPLEPMVQTGADQANSVRIHHHGPQPEWRDQLASPDYSATHHRPPVRGNRRS